MTTPIIAFFNNKGGVGKTSLVYHLAWMYFDLGLQVVAADLDPQANLTAAFLDEDRLEEVWESSNSNNYNTVFRCVRPLLSGIGDIATPNLEKIEDGLSLLIGDLQLSGFEDELSSQWSDCLDRKERAFRVISAFWRVLSQAASSTSADVVLVDLGPNLGAINRAALIASDYIIVPLSPDLFSLQGLKNLGPTVKRWREEWRERIPKNPALDLALPQGKMQPVGYVILQHGVRFDRPVKAFQRWIEKIPGIYREKVIENPKSDNEELTQKQDEVALAPSSDPNRLALLKHYQSLMPMAQESRKPIFHLKPADGAIGAHIDAVRLVYWDFKDLAQKIANRTELLLPSSQSSLELELKK
ncbi:MAG: ParA family protein [Leptolyngbyaceae cyanobacterium SM1_4_3]|nr:ParA family protein [Leptolyngbyaceae cyanobacterium SM1_4_3]NJN88977.1 ParA family protein [Leptolyngbyaceae cyanobacterium SL_5_14]NJO66206.1 ParA family protein [Leptolyngbyaceae cyanobacterium RM1_405_57]